MRLPAGAGADTCSEDAVCSRKCPRRSSFSVGRRSPRPALPQPGAGWSTFPASSVPEPVTLRCTRESTARGAGWDLGRGRSAGLRAPPAQPGTVGMLSVTRLSSPVHRTSPARAAGEHLLPAIQGVPSASVCVSPRSGDWRPDLFLSLSSSSRPLDFLPGHLRGPGALFVTASTFEGRVRGSLLLLGAPQPRPSASPCTL